MKWTLLFFTLLALPFATSAELMTVQHLRDQLRQGPVGELGAVAYVQGVIDGEMAMDSLHHKERNTPLEFCVGKNGPVKHPAYRTKELVLLWEKQGRPMDTIAVDFVLSFLSTQYGCRKPK